MSGAGWMVQGAGGCGHRTTKHCELRCKVGRDGRARRSVRVGVCGHYGKEMSSRERERTAGGDDATMRRCDDATEREDGLECGAVMGFVGVRWAVGGVRRVRRRVDAASASDAVMTCAGNAVAGVCCEEAAAAAAAAAAGTGGSSRNSQMRRREMKARERENKACRCWMSRSCTRIHPQANHADCTPAPDERQARRRAQPSITWQSPRTPRTPREIARLERVPPARPLEPPRRTVFALGRGSVDVLMPSAEAYWMCSSPLPKGKRLVTGSMAAAAERPPDGEPPWPRPTRTQLSRDRPISRISSQKLWLATRSLLATAMNRHNSAEGKRASIAGSGLLRQATARHPQARASDKVSPSQLRRRSHRRESRLVHLRDRGLARVR
ncbi:hypothetical protein L1887_59095 [Cichorium endivia]|nr:hypothetical protein L1887_59095 [Cichorium endivia]